MIKVTDEMIVTARDAGVALNGHCSTYEETKVSLAAALALIDRDYVARWGKVTIPLGAAWQAADERFMDATRVAIVEMVRRRD